MSEIPAMRHRHAELRSALMSAIVLVIVVLMATSASGQDSSPATAADADDAATSPDSTPETPREVNVTSVAQDDEIVERLEEILTSTEWFADEEVDVRNGVAFLRGTTTDERFREWAGTLAGKTEDVVAVVNRIKVREPPIFDLTPAWMEIKDLGRGAIRTLPLLGISLVLLLLTWFAASALQSIGDSTFLKRIQTKLLREVTRKAVVIPVLLLGLFLVLRITGLTQLALTLLGGTGLFGLVVGIAFRDIAENFLSSILLSMQNPFRYGDLIEVDGKLGFVQRVNTRGTLLMTMDGNHVQIPNSTIYKGTIVNFTSNPNRRFSFVIGIGYDTAPTEAQETALRVLDEHPAVLDDPEPQVLVESLGSSTVNLTIYAWVDASQHSWIKVQSSVMRLVLKAAEDAGFSMPDDQREIVFPAGVPVQMLSTDDTPATSQVNKPEPTQSTRSEVVSNKAEGDFRSEAAELQQQARQSRDPEEGEADLLDGHQTTAPGPAGRR
ncbi:MAG: mechanosensitive ion channel family protein [Planctomycetaceae bacterium]